MKFTTASGQLAAEFNPFDEDYLAEILEAVTVAWSRIKPPKQRDWEDDITNRLAGHLSNVSPFTDLPYAIDAQKTLLDLNGKILGRLDLHFRHCHSRRDYFAFETKRLHVTSPGGRFSPEYHEYVGDPGMMAFIEGQYSKNLPAGGMLGYVMDGETNKAWDGLATRIESRRQELKLGVSSKLTKSNLSHIEASGMFGTLLGETAHQIAHKLRLFHLLLPVAN